MSNAEIDAIATVGSTAYVERAEAPSVRAACDILSPPLWVWSDPEGQTRVGAGSAKRIVAEGETRFGAIGDSIGTLTAGLGDVPGGPGAFIGARFFPTTRGEAIGWSDFPSAIATVPSLQLTWNDDITATISVYSTIGSQDASHRLADLLDRFERRDPPRQSLPAVVNQRYEPSPADWRAGIETALERLHRPPLEKVVLAGTSVLDLDAPPSIGSLVEALIERHPDCWVYAYAPNRSTIFIGATPERLATMSGDRLETVALAGSIKRGETLTGDDQLADVLLDRERGRHEQANVVGDIVKRLGPITEVIRVDSRRIRRLTDVQHIESPISARLRQGTGLLEVTSRLHPTPAVGGRPRASALATIAEIEMIERGWYAAPIGFVEPDGTGTLAVGIRSARIDGSTATLFAGNGIVPESDPSDEWDELVLKFRAIGGVFG